MKRRTLLQGAALALAAPAGAQPAPLTRTIPATGEAIPRVGLGTWITFNVGNDPPARAQCAQVMRAFFAAGGRLVDSSPMYGSSQGVVGEALRSLGAQGQVFSADKVWTGGDGVAQVEASRRLWQLPRFDLLQVHNLLAWEKQLPLLQAMKDRGQLRYVGITTSEGRRHREFEQVMRGHKLDFVQFTYNVVDREAEQRLLPLAAERGIAVLANRPFQEGELLRRLQRHPLPPWAAEIGCASWAQFALKFIVSHPAVTCAIPATRRVDHVRENLAAASGPMPDEAMRRRMAAHVAGL
ncbi:aldo/keto reductase [Ramlibacter sp. USB13]|uniref:Aldo/keto reductase n=1 Tax=Ramlibacter cellulosilyticus TaxID=2764187 RepID=A0A923SDD0_9BURK|nr:aldo/keto reductase [Ramlibacter cellulosilyticus]MBC5785906.1 aldo/keto reductase [Ramlibacter cellulosilyticus]